MHIPKNKINNFDHGKDGDSYVPRGASLSTSDFLARRGVNDPGASIRITTNENVAWAEGR
jgi:hypothetical protein